jgi:hypothetical protein
MFTKGQRVVCINDEFPALALETHSQLPKKDSAYTVRSVNAGRGNLTKAESGQRDGAMSRPLEELANRRVLALKSGLPGELGLYSERFAPLEYDTDSDSLTEKKEDEDLMPA